MAHSRQSGRWRLLIALVAYPAIFAALIVLAEASDLGSGAVVLLAAPSIVTGALVRRDWMYAVPLLGIGAWMVVAAGTPCDGCDDGPAAIALLGFFMLGGGSLMALGIGDTIGTLWTRGRRQPEDRRRPWIPLGLGCLLLGAFVVLADAEQWLAAIVAGYLALLGASSRRAGRSELNRAGCLHEQR